MSGTTVKVVRQVTVGDKVINQETEISVQTLITIDEDVSDGVTDELLLMGVDVSELKVVYLHSDAALTLETNDGTTPADTIALAANTPVLWVSGDPAANKPLGTDVTGLYKTNASGGSARLRGYIGFGTP